MKQNNPFLISGYILPKYFCDREKETAQVIEAVKNKRNLTLFSLRRIGKTGLIKHVFYKLSKEKKYSTFYLDIQDTSDLKEFTIIFAEAVIGKFDTFSDRVIQNIGKIFSGLTPTITYDPLTGQPTVSLDIRSEKEAGASLEQIFEYLEKQNKNIVLAIDEFQQILNYPEKNIEALLRKYVQKAKNISFIFAGSHKHMLISMFKDHSRPFYQSTEVLHLEPIELKKYKKFIDINFNEKKMQISENSIEFILGWTKRHTFYVQFVCNRLFSLSEKEITPEMVNRLLSEILNENKVVYNNYRNLLSKNQWNLLKAIAKEDSVKQILSRQFIEEHKLGTPSSISAALKVLLDKEMVYRLNDSYHVTDLFLSRWLAGK